VGSKTKEKPGGLPQFGAFFYLYRYIKEIHMKSYNFLVFTAAAFAGVEAARYAASVEVNQFQ
jgi:hypothetical protein